MPETAAPETMARLRHHRTSPTKVRQVLRLIVGKNVADARETLRFCERGPAETVMKLLDSAVANAEHNDNIPEEELYVSRAFADEGPTMKRTRTRHPDPQAHQPHHHRGGALPGRRARPSPQARSGRHHGAAGQPPPPGAGQPAQGRA